MKKGIIKTILCLSLLIIACSSEVFGMAGANYTLGRDVLSDGIPDTGSTNYNLLSTLSQPSATGASSSSSYNNYAGFWYIGIIKHTLTVNSTGTGGGALSSNPAGINYNYPALNTGNALFDYGANVTLTITANAGSMVWWNNTCSAAGGTEAGNGTGTATCSFSSLSEDKNVTAIFSLLTSDDDNDGIINSIEGGSPNGGDGNNDGIQDSIQAEVTSLPSATGQGYLTLAVSGGCGELQNVQAYTEGQMAVQDYNHDYLYGLVSFVLPCENATVAITYHNATDLTGLIYKKYGPTTPGDNSTIQWYNFPNAVIAGNVITLTLADNVLGDDTGDDGIIYDQGGPTDPHPIPTMTEWGMIIFMLLAGLGAIYSIRKQRKV